MHAFELPVSSVGYYLPSLEASFADGFPDGYPQILGHDGSHFFLKKKSLQLTVSYSLPVYLNAIALITDYYFSTTNIQIT